MKSTKEEIAESKKQWSSDWAAYYKRIREKYPEVDAFCRKRNNFYNKRWLSKPGNRERFNAYQRKRNEKRKQDPVLLMKDRETRALAMRRMREKYKANPDSPAAIADREARKRVTLKWMKNNKEKVNQYARNYYAKKKVFIELRPYWFYAVPIKEKAGA